MGEVLPPGTRLGRYEIVQRLALGGMAEIYLARMSGLAGFAKHVVLKRILPSYARDAEFVRMFFNEARYAATLDHPNIAHVYDLGEEHGLHYFTMEYLHGEDVRTLLRELASDDLALPLEHALTIVVGAATGCHFAHELQDDDGQPLGLVHRDVSPSNVVVTYAGAVKLVDFGIAKATKLEDVTAIGVTKGKLAYMAPEQCRGESLDRRVDVYALGVLLYELTTQRRAFAGQNDAQIMYAVLSGDVPPPSKHRADFPPHLEQIIQRAMHVDRAARFATARELAQALEAFARDRGLTLNPGALGEFLERVRGPKLEPWKTGERGDGKPGKKSGAPLAVAAPLPPGADVDALTFAPTPLPRLDSGTEPAALSSASLVRQQDPDTIAETPAAKAAAHSKPWLVLGGATLAAVGLIGATLWWRSQRAAPDLPSGPPIVMITETGDAKREFDSGTATATPDAATAAEATVDAGARVPVVDGGRAPPRPPPQRPEAKDPLSLAVRRREGLVERCFTSHPEVVTGMQEISLRFEVGRTGVPTKVEVTPKELARSAVGACIVEVGLGTKFPPRAEPFAFNIPVQVKPSGGGT